MENHTQSPERKFTIGNLEIRRLNLSDNLILASFSIAILIQFLIGYYEPSKKYWGVLFIPFIIGLATVSTPFGLKFRSVYFSVIWLTLSIVFLFNGTTMSRVPLYTFLFYHLICLLFWKKYDKEFIPLHAVRNGYIRYVSKIEGRGGYKEDRRCMRVLLWVGLALIMYCLFGIVGIDLKNI
jgi:hypothetical protein